MATSLSSLRCDETLDVPFDFECCFAAKGIKKTRALIDTHWHYDGRMHAKQMLAEYRFVPPHQYTVLFQRAQCTICINACADGHYSTVMYMSNGTYFDTCTCKAPIFVTGDVVNIYVMK